MNGIIQRWNSRASPTVKVPTQSVPAASDWALLRSVVASPSSGTLWANGQDRVVRFYRSGTHALAEGIQMVARAHRNPEITVWVPAYFCHGALNLVRGPDVSIKFYPIHPDLRPDWQWLEDNAGRVASPQVFLLVHYFGFPVAAEETKTFCDRHGMVFFEDAAHVLQPTDEMGDGDFTLFCPYKFLAVPQVGVLVTSPRWAQGREDGIVDVGWREALGWAGRGLARRILARLPLPQGTSNRIGIKPSDPPTLRLLAKAEEELRHRPRTIMERRRRNYLSLLTSMSGLPGVHPLLPTLPSGVCPWLMPILVEGGSRELAKRLWARGIPTFQWRDVPPDVSANPAMYTIAIAYYEKVLSLPVHQGLSAQQIDLIGEHLAAAADTREPSSAAPPSIGRW